jgi:hypothetical protein
MTKNEVSKVIVDKRFGKATLKSLTCYFLF